MNDWGVFSPEPVLAALAAAGVDFVVIGGLAVVAHGGVRLTQDLDLCLEPSQENRERAATALNAFAPRLRGVEEELPWTLDARALRQSSILCLATEHGAVDLLSTPAGAPAYDALRARATVVDLGGVPVPIAGIPDLIAMKRASDRPKDRLDLEQLLVILAESDPEGDAG